MIACELLQTTSLAPLAPSCHLTITSARVLKHRQGESPRRVGKPLVWTMKWNWASFRKPIQNDWNIFSFHHLSHSNAAFLPFSLIGQSYYVACNLITSHAPYLFKLVQTYNCELIRLLKTPSHPFRTQQYRHLHTTCLRHLCLYLFLGHNFVLRL